MTRVDRYQHVFVDAFPDRLEEGVLYVSTEFGNTAHRCMCGCGQEVYARLSPRDWSMIYDGETVSLRPSIGNWSFACQSHYWLDGGAVAWADRWSKDQIARGRNADRQAKARHYGVESGPQTSPPEHSDGILARFLRWLRR